eukprot:scaffold1833_cov263-Chaetoceros_neogracile.AAC.13
MSKTVDEGVCNYILNFKLILLRISTVLQHHERAEEYKNAISRWENSKRRDPQGFVLSCKVTSTNV